MTRTIERDHSRLPVAGAEENRYSVLLWPLDAPVMGIFLKSYMHEHDRVTDLMDKYKIMNQCG